MSVTIDILASYRAPQRVIRHKLAQGVREDRALAYLMVACLLIWVSGLPALARLAQTDPSIPLEGRIAGALFAWATLVPLGAYVLAGVFHVAARVVGGQGSWYGARLALFWALLAATPLWLLHGLVAGLIGQGPAQQIVALAALAGFLYLWVNGCWAPERPLENERG